MQLYALLENTPIPAKLAQRHLTYSCPECSGNLKVRGGSSKQLHFYHLSTSQHCRQHQKTQEHLQTQLRLLYLLGPSAQIEWRSPISRIADVAGLEQNIIFEIQCSPISWQEAKERCEDYERLGLSILWFLHDKRFNKKRVCKAEEFLRSKGAYYTNINAKGEGIFYDQFEIMREGRRLFRGPALPLDPTQILKTPPPIPENAIPQAIQLRSLTWNCFLNNDLLYQYARHHNPSLLRLEQRYLHPPAPKRLNTLSLLKKGYLHLLQELVKRC